MKIRRFATIGALVGLGLIGGFCAVEGTSSLVLLAADVVLHPGAFARFGGGEPTERYDAELGWVPRPNLSIPDHFGPGIFLRTDAQGFRGDREVRREAPRERLRVICSGDSFTFGYGVDDDHTWCHLLESMGTQFTTVNMGEEGYGIDQAYLWYVRSGSSLQHAVHVFAVITQDFYRIAQPTFFGYGKPLLALEDGHLALRNVPVPRARFAFLLAPLLIRLDAAVAHLRAVELVRRVRHGRVFGSFVHNDEHVRRDERTWQVASKIFDTLQRMDRDSGSALLIVYLPTGADYMTRESDPWRERLRAESRKSGFFLLDLVPALRGLSGSQMAALFQSKTSPGGGHYSDAGHAWAAKRIYDELLSLPPVADRLARARGIRGTEACLGAAPGPVLATAPAGCTDVDRPGSAATSGAAEAHGAISRSR